MPHFGTLAPGEEPPVEIPRAFSRGQGHAPQYAKRRRKKKKTTQSPHVVSSINPLRLRCHLYPLSSSTVILHVHWHCPCSSACRASLFSVGRSWHGRSKRGHLAQTLNLSLPVRQFRLLEDVAILPFPRPMETKRTGMRARSSRCFAERVGACKTEGGSAGKGLSFVSLAEVLGAKFGHRLLDLAPILVGPCSYDAAGLR